jgi:DNA-binding NarL/FixJ family response regulator
MAVRILIVDDHEVVRQGVASILKSRPGWEICGETGDGEQAIDAVVGLEPDVVILDINMPGMSGLEAASQISRLGTNCRVLIFTMHESSRIISDVRAVGAQGYVQKSQAGRDLILAIETVLAVGAFFSPKDTLKASS